ncbi:MULTISPECIES: CvpA family protein [Enterococcus]|uniref:CvpA family protein n=1 Tax=Enterococcus alishanensis TaxID=1303817 RepID=A0ABS6T9E9_9ENTE|nr:CvpA family protein [Enterococcus alishanensis]MBV7389528.1 CvpA family protein [Enterococcus alishanensis]
MLTFIILFAFLLAIYTGYRRGTAYQLVFSIGYLISFIVARQLYQNLGSKFELYVPYPSVTENSQMVYYTVEEAFRLDQAFYAGFAFLLILGIGWLLTHFVGIFFRNLLFKKLLPRYDSLVSMILQIINCYVAIFLILKLMTFVPMGFVQNLIEQSWYGKMIIEHSLILSRLFDTLWVTNIIG